eukprot:CAMPEP_0113450904 /NCGR_PEP_ID=MMETSP0014_2-20120614/6067_1 /TAXON_ID=2857 /ORGANISM="Nitzschia sp." /LENGTH=132 /DNA_ID=CAMNT_0000342251 /DNA_START=79 /DNA_END=474 /DNA_ORIENTATION=- /assembly_acc=CAM_ASM_000159
MVQQMKFATKITALQHREWSEYYLDYNGLKRILAEVDDPTSLLEAGDGNGSDAGTSSTASVSLVTKTHFKDEVVTSTKFLAELYKEAQKICLFVLNEQGQIASELDECNQKLDELANICRTMDEDGDENETA